MSKEENEREKKAYNKSGTKRELKRIQAQAYNKKDLMFLWSKKARPFIQFFGAAFLTAAAGRFTQWEGRRFGIFHNLGGNAARC